MNGSDDLEEIKLYTKEEYLDGVEPYEFLYQFKDDDFKLEKMLTKMSLNAQKVGVRNLKKLFAMYVKSQRTTQNTIYYDNVTQFEGQELELDSGQWRADDCGITIDSPFGGESVACVHPLLPVLRLVNIDTGVEKLKLAYRKGKQWRYVIADKKMLASNNSIINLAEVGIAVNSENAKLLVRYLHDIENLNYDTIPEKNSVSRLGWIDGEGFSPYVENLVFDGDVNYKSFFESVREKGSYEKWLNFVKEKVRNGTTAGRIVLASAFASVLLKPLNGSPFFVHLWGGTETAKSVMCMVAASVWADPEIGKYIHTFNSTNVGREKSAAFVNSLPLILDELQIVNDKKDLDKEVYMLSEGTGRTRGNKSGGVDKTPTWKNCIITNGEKPLTNLSSGGGAVNRIVEIECEENFFDDPRGAAKTVLQNFGFAGPIFIGMLKIKGNIEKAEAIFEDFYKKLSDNDTTQKQAAAGAFILTADALITEWIFRDDKALKVWDIAKYLQTKSSVSINERGYEFLCEYVVQNVSKFCGESDLGEVWGAIENNQVFIIRNVFNKICDENGFNAQSLLSWLRQTGKIETHKKGFTKTKKINGIPCNCVFMRLMEEDGDKTGLIEDI